MESTKTTITVESSVNAPVEKVWQYWNSPEHIVKWAAASDDWHTTKSENDVRAGGKFLSRMEAKDGSFGFDFGGIYDTVREHQQISYTLGDGRKVDVQFDAEAGKTQITEVFEAENMHSVEMQQAGWQAILDNFKKYVEAN